MKAQIIPFPPRSLDEASCAEYLISRRWPEGFLCPNCHSRRATSLKTRSYTFECLDCRRQTSITAGTVMHNSKLPLTLWFRAAHLIATKPNDRDISAQQFKSQLEIPYKTAWLLRQKFQRSMNRRMLEGIVDIGIEKMRFRAGHRGHKTKGGSLVTVAAALEENSHDLRLGVLPEESHGSVEAFVHQHVKPGATLSVDLEFVMAGYDHRERSDLLVSQTFTWLRRYRQLRDKPVEIYLDKFVAFHNERLRELTFDQVLGILLTSLRRIPPLSRPQDGDRYAAGLLGNPGASQPIADC